MPLAPPASAAAGSAPAASGEREPEYTPDGFLKIGNEGAPPGSLEVRGYDFNRPGGVDWRALLSSYATTGFQARALALACAEVERMISWRLSDEAVRPVDAGGRWAEPALRARTRCTVFLAFTSNIMSAGTREVLRYLVQHRMVSAVVTTAGAVEEDVMKTLAPHYVGDWGETRGAALRMRGLNRLGDLLVPNRNYEALEAWFSPLLARMHDEQGGGEDGRSPLRRAWTPSAMIARMGAELEDESSVWYWAARNRIPVFCPGLTDGAIGDMLFWHSWERPGFLLDVAGDVRRINKAAMRAKKSGMLILGGGTAKHHTCNANLMRNGADFSVYVNTGAEFDGSDAGARPDEAVSWGKIRIDAKPVKVYADATLVLPLMVAHTWAAHRDAALAAAAGAPSHAQAAAADLLACGWAEAAEDADDADAVFAYAHADAAAAAARAERAKRASAATAAEAATSAGAV